MLVGMFDGVFVFVSGRATVNDMFDGTLEYRGFGDLLGMSRLARSMRSGMHRGATGEHTSLLAVDLQDPSPRETSSVYLIFLPPQGLDERRVGHYSIGYILVIITYQLLQHNLLTIPTYYHRINRTYWHIIVSASHCRRSGIITYRLTVTQISYYNISANSHSTIAHH